MGKVKQLHMDIQYILNVLSAHGEQKAVEAFEICTQSNANYSKYQCTVNALIPLVNSRHILRDLDDHDQLCVQTIDTETGDVEDLFPMNVDVIENIRLTDDTIVQEVRFCQMDNAEPDTRDKIELVDAVIKAIDGRLLSWRPDGSG
ncbi:MAG: hypothetical protein U5L95_02470 [Candidatus Saccharibacteria bacterium]|nr:hypothetical protein [Candidatus Saccharibacteria bacterium]